MSLSTFSLFLIICMKQKRTCVASFSFRFHSPLLEFAFENKKLLDISCLSSSCKQRGERNKKSFSLSQFKREREYWEINKEMWPAIKRADESLRKHQEISCSDNKNYKYDNYLQKKKLGIKDLQFVSSIRSLCIINALLPPPSSLCCDRANKRIMTALFYCTLTRNLRTLVVKHERAHI